MEIVETKTHKTLDKYIMNVDFKKLYLQRYQQAFSYVPEFSSLIGIYYFIIYIIYYHLLF